MKNIILIGMPGCGKTTIGKLLAQELNREFVDADAEIIAEAGMSVSEIFEKKREYGFREIETKVLARLGQQSGLVIATGGGCVTKEENYPLLHQNGTICWIKRDTNSLSTNGRPLSQSGKLEEMYRIRKPMYEQFADFEVTNDGTLEDVVAKIVKELNK